VLVHVGCCLGWMDGFSITGTGKHWKLLWTFGVLSVDIYETTILPAHSISLGRHLFGWSCNQPPNVFDLVMGHSLDMGHLAITVSHILK